MSPRYLLVAGAGEPGWGELLGRLAGRTGLEMAFSNARVAALVNRHCSCLVAGAEGCVIGTLFHRHGRALLITSLDDADAGAILNSRGDKLINSFWGGYVAAVAGPDFVRIVRDPSAALSCYFSLGPGYVAFASDAELLVESGVVDIELNWHALARHLYSGGVPTPATALHGISELLPGFAVQFPGQVECQVKCWSPWDHVPEHSGGADMSAERLSRAIKYCVRAWAAGHRRLLVSVSGGLDSSIIAACLAASGAESVCLTMYGEDPTGDERPFARALCDHLGLPLVERGYHLDNIDITEPLGTHLPRTKDRTQALAYERAHRETAQEIGATAFVTGNGGDSVFGYSQSASAVADRYLSEGMGGGVLRTLRDVCVQTGCGLLEAAASALRIAHGPPSYRCRPDPLFLDPEMLAELAGARLEHPWLAAPADALPGKAAHIASILRVQQCLEPDRSRYLPVLNPLMSQPVIEACLAVPSWEWREGGRDRSLARRAFADDLPSVVLRRRVKGGPDGFAAQILDRFRVCIRERLLEGHLARQGIIDRDALEEVLGHERPTLGEQRVRILEFVAAEAWLDSWLSRARSAGAGPRTRASSVRCSAS